MPKCPNCGEELDDDNREWVCPFCGYNGWRDGFFHCYNCDTLVDWNGICGNAKTAVMRA